MRRFERMTTTLRVRGALVTAVLAVAGCAAAPEGEHAGAASAAPIGSAPIAPNRPNGAAPVAIPPGVDRAALTPRDSADRRAWLPLEDALLELVADAPPLAVAADRPPHVDPEQRDEALRLYLRGRDAGLQGRRREAVAYLEHAATIDPGAPAILRELARIYAAGGDATRAIALFVRLYQLDPDDSEARFTLAVAALAQRDFQRAGALLAEPRLHGAGFTHDPAADLLADFALSVALGELGYDRALASLGAGVASAPLDFEQTAYFGRVEALLEQRGALWETIGDAYCRLGEYQAALEAYANGAAELGEGLAALDVRAIYANLRLGQLNGAAEWLRAALASGDEPERDLLIRECGSLPPGEARTTLARAVQAAQGGGDGDAETLTRAAAALAGDTAAVAMLRAQLRKHPRDVRVMGDLFTRLDPGAATALAARLIRANPDLADEIVDRLLVAIPDAGRRFLPPPAGTLRMRDPDDVVLAARALLRLSGFGDAWRVCAAGLDEWPDDEALLRLRIEIAGWLDEALLLDEALDAAQHLGDAWTDVVRTKALGETEQFDRSIEAGHAAVATSIAEGRYQAEARVLLAGGLVTRAARSPFGPQRDQDLRRAIELGEEARSIVPDHLAPYELLAVLYGPEGLGADPERYRRLLADLDAVPGGGRLRERLLVQELLISGQPGRALDRALALADGDPADREAQSVVLMSFTRLGRSDDAEAWLRRRLETSAAHPAALDQLVRLLAGRERTDEALRLLEAARARGGDDPGVLRLLEMVEQIAGDNDRAVALGERRLHRRPPGTRRELELALLYARADRSDEALECIEEMSERAPEAPLRHLTGAIGLCGRLDVPDRERDAACARLVERTVAAHPTAPFAVYAAGLRSLARLGPVDQRFTRLAESAARDAETIGDTPLRRVLPWRDLAQDLVDAGAAAAAATALREDLRVRLDEALVSGGLSPEDPAIEAITLLVSMIVAADAKRPGGAEASLEMLEDLDARHVVPVLSGATDRPTLAGAMAGAGQFFSLVGNEAGSERLLRESIRLDAADPMTKNNLGYMLIEEGRDDEQTVTWIEEAGAAAPGEASIVDTLAWLRYKQGRFQADGTEPGAVELLERAISLIQEPSAEVLDHYGDALWRIGREDASMNAWREAADLLEASEHRERIVRNYRDVQSLAWGLLVADPVEMYDRNFGAVLDRTRRKLAAAEDGEEPPLASTFGELVRSN